MSRAHVHWSWDEPPEGPIVIWRGGRWVGQQRIEAWERRYVAEEEVESLRQRLSEAERLLDEWYETDDGSPSWMRGFAVKVREFLAKELAA